MERVLWKGCRIGSIALNEDTRQGAWMGETGILGIRIGQCSLRFSLHALEGGD